MQACGRQAKQPVAQADARAVNQERPIDHADDEAGQIVFPWRVEIGHLGGFPSDQGATRFVAPSCQPGHHLLDDIRLELAAGDIIEKKSGRAPCTRMSDTQCDTRS